MHRTLITWAIGFGLYLLFSGQTGRAAFCAAAVTATFGAVLVLFLRLRGSARIRVRAPWATLAFRVGRSIAVDVVLVARALLAAVAGQAVRGMLVRQPFESGPVAAADNARRGIVFLLGSLAPNGFVLDMDEDGSALAIHRLVAAPRSPDEQWPV